MHSLSNQPAPHRLDQDQPLAPQSATTNDVVAQLLPQRAPGRLLLWSAYFWLASAVLHTTVWLFDGGSLSGSVSWRKPIVFSASIGLLLWAIGWLLDRLPDRPRLAWPLAVTMVVSSSIETGLIALQTWRGRPSHFNISTAGDSAIFSVMGAMVGVMSIVIVTVFVWSLVRRPASAADRIASFWGFALIVAGLGIGQWLITLGFDYVSRFDDVPPVVTYGENGVAKFPHAVAFHGVQVFAVGAALLSAAGAGVARTRLLLGGAVASYLAVMVFATVQTLGGRAPTDLVVGSSILLAMGIVGLGVTFTTMARPLLPTRTRPLTSR